MLLRQLQMRLQLFGKVSHGGFQRIALQALGTFPSTDHHSAFEPFCNRHFAGKTKGTQIIMRQATQFNLVFLNVYDGGQAYTESQHRDWLTDAGFGDIKHEVQPNGTSIVSARKSA